MMISGFFLAEVFGKVNPNISYFHYLKQSFVDQSIQNNNYSIFKTEAVMMIYREYMYRT